MTIAKCLSRIGSRFLVSHLRTHTSQLPTVQPGIEILRKKTYKITKRQEMGCQRLPKWSQKVPKAPKRHPAAAQRRPSEPKGAPKGISRGPKGAPKRSPGGPKGSPRVPQGVPRDPQGSPQVPRPLPRSFPGRGLGTYFGGSLKRNTKMRQSLFQDLSNKGENSKNIKV